MLDRKTAPEIQKINKINYEIPNLIKTENGIPIYSLFCNNSPVVRIDVIFKAGIDYQTTKKQALFSNLLMREATEGLLPDETSEFFEYHGSFIENFVGVDTAGFRLYAPSKHVDKVLPVFLNFITKPLLPEKEFELLKDKYFEIEKNNQKKTKHIAFNRLNAELFGESHPRGNIVLPEDIKNLRLNQIKEFVNFNYLSDNCFVFISGEIDENTMKICNTIFNSFNKTRGDNLSKMPIPNIKESDNFFRYIEMENPFQSSICIGKRLVNYTDDELIDLSFLNTILGGYFGSRLMNNLREQKAYTYNIGSVIIEYPKSTVIKISTDVGVDFTKNAIDEIYKEIDILTKNPISNEELRLVKNYIIGETISSFDGVFNSSKSWERLIARNKDFGLVQEKIDRIQTITPSDLLHTAQKHFGNEGFHTVVAGKME